MYKYDELLLTPSEYIAYEAQEEEATSPAMQTITQNFEEISLASLEQNIQSQTEREALGQQISNIELMILSGSNSDSTTTTTA